MSQVDPNLANKVLRTDLKNLLDKVASGKILNATEREIFSKIHLEQEDIGKRRQLALLHNWTRGKRLNHGELTEIATLLPEGAFANLVREIREPESGEPRSIAEVAKVYAPIYAVSARTVERWIARGVEVSEPCPLHRPDLLRRWWATHMKQRVPDTILSASIKYEKNELTAENMPSTAPAKVAPKLPPTRLSMQPKLDDFPEDLELGAASKTLKSSRWREVDDSELDGFKDRIRRMKQLEVLAHDAYREALEKGDDREADAAFRKSLQLSESLMKFENQLIEHQQKIGDLIQKDVAVDALAGLHAQIVKQIRNAGESFLRRVGLEPTGERVELWQLEVDAIFEAMGRDIFGETEQEESDD